MNERINCHVREETIEHRPKFEATPVSLVRETRCACVIARERGEEVQTGGGGRLHAREGDRTAERERERTKERENEVRCTRSRSLHFIDADIGFAVPILKSERFLESSEPSIEIKSITPSILTRSIDTPRANLAEQESGSVCQVSTNDLFYFSPRNAIRVYNKIQSIDMVDFT